MSKEMENAEKWVNPAVREENAHIDLRSAPKFYMATVNNTVLETDVSLKYLEKRYREKPSITLWECQRGLPRKVVRRGTSRP